MRNTRKPDQLFIDDVFVDLADIIDARLSVKCEAFNFAGSVKLKAAAFMVAAAEEAGRLSPGSMIIESSSGNLGVALSIVAASKGYEFVCVTDPRASSLNRRRIEAAGGRVVIVDELDDNGGYLATRIRTVREMCAADPRYHWLNQYANDDNWRAHYRLTGPAIVRTFPALEYLFVGAGTTGTLMGCARYLRDLGHPARVVAVDSVGSVTFGGSPGSRHIPGLGTSRRPELLDRSLVDDVLLVHEVDAVTMCRRLARHGFLFGGSTGTVVAGAEHFLAARGAKTASALAISPDLADSYLDTVYDDEWVTQRFGPAALTTEASGTGDLVGPMGRGIA